MSWRKSKWAAVISHPAFAICSTEAAFNLGRWFCVIDLNGAITSLQNWKALESLLEWFHTSWRQIKPLLPLSSGTETSIFPLEGCYQELLPLLDKQHCHSGCLKLAYTSTTEVKHLSLLMIKSLGMLSPCITFFSKEKVAVLEEVA